MLSKLRRAQIKFAFLTHSTHLRILILIRIMFLRNCRKLCFTIFRFALFLWEKILFWLKFLHYEVFNVHLPLFATACLVYRMSHSLSTTFLTFFRKFFTSLYRASGARLVVSRDSLFIIPNLLPLVNSFFQLFSTFFAESFSYI